MGLAVVCMQCNSAFVHYISTIRQQTLMEGRSRHRQICRENIFASIKNTTFREKNSGLFYMQRNSEIPRLLQIKFKLWQDANAVLKEIHATISYNACSYNIRANSLLATRSCI